jgi:Ca2+-binding RTX toxin-like protein
LASGDFNGDGKLDLVAPLSGNGSGSAAVLLGHGDGTFGSPSVIADGNNPLFAEVAVGDLNGDTKSDLVFAGTGFLVGNISIALGNGDGAFAFPASHALGSSASSVAVADFNTDSVPDVATTNQGSSVVWVLPGVGKGNLGTPQSFPAGGPIAVTVGNFNADVLPDMATADPDAVNGNDRVTALLNKTPLPSPAPTVSVAAGGSCRPNGPQGTIELALVAAEHPNSELSLSVTSSNHDLVPTRDTTFGGSGASRTLTVSAVRGRSGSAVVTVNRLSDAQLTGSVQVTVRVAANGANSVTGDDGADILFGQNGADSLDGLGGNDLLCGGNGADSLSGGEGDDTLDGGRGPDRLAGGSGADRFAGGPGKDRAGDLNPAEGDTQDGTVP